MTASAISVFPVPVGLTTTPRRPANPRAGSAGGSLASGRPAGGSRDRTEGPPPGPFRDRCPWADLEAPILAGAACSARPYLTVCPERIEIEGGSLRLTFRGTLATLSMPEGPTDDCRQSGEVRDGDSSDLRGAAGGHGGAPRRS